MLRFYRVSNERDTANIMVGNNIVVVQYESTMPFEIGRQQAATYFTYWRRCGWNIERKQEGIIGG